MKCTGCENVPACIVYTYKRKTIIHFFVCGVYYRFVLSRLRSKQVQGDCLCSNDSIINRKPPNREHSMHSKSESTKTKMLKKKTC